jgi:two-component sensor histidine kinase
MQSKIKKNLESLNNDVNSAVDDYSKVIVIISFCRNNYSTIQEDTFHFIKKGIRLSELNSFISELTTLKTYRAFYLLHYEKRKKAIALCNNILPGLLYYKSYFEYGLTVIILCQIDWSKGNLEKAFAIVKDSLELLKYKRNKNPALVQLHWMLGVFYFDINDLQQAYNHYSCSFKCIDKNTDIAMIAYIQIGLAGIYKKRSEYIKAVELYKNIAKISEENDMWLVQSRACYEIGIVKMSQNVFEEAEGFISKSYKIRKKNNAIPAMLSSIIALAEIYYEKGNYIQAEKKLNEALDICNEKKLKSKKSKICQLFSKVCEAQNKFELAFSYLKDYNILEKEINKHKLQNKDKYFQLKYNLQRAQKDSDSQKILNKKLKKSNEIILKQKNKLINANREKEVLLKEIHHRVKNNLQIITSLLSLQAISIKDEKTKTFFDNSQYRINSMSLIHEMLYQSDILSEINYKDYLNKLLNKLVYTFKGFNHNINILIDVPEMYLNIDTAIPLGLLINEIVTNSLKYAFRDDIPGVLKLNITSKEENHYKMIISDDGPGFSPDFDYMNSNSLGMKLIFKLAKQINGNVKYENLIHGAGYIINFVDVAPSKLNSSSNK